ncbi:MAG: hypothetical protein IKF98_09730 [Clostridia bacterium]|nr:hypothetical protein [Clostridia bacterium]MBR3274179.1 hypothetical protein [Clostridia bacterium]
MSMTRVRVRRERPTALALAVALCVTMLVVYVLTLDVKRPDAVESMAATPRVTKEIAFDDLSGWAVSMATCESQQAARLQASAWVGRGAAGCVRELDGQWRVLGALYDSRKTAERISQRLTETEGIPAEVIHLEAKGLTLRVTAPVVQIEAVAGADALLRRQGRQLGEVALQLDKGEITPDAARTLCALAATEAAALADSLAAIPGAGENALCAALTGRLRDLAKMQDAVARGDHANATALSGMLRCAQIEGFMGMREMMEKF